MAQTNVNIRMDENIKKEADVLFQELGLTMSSAVNAFIRQALRQRGIPFDLSLNVPNAETLAAMQEIEDMRSGKLPQNPQSVESLFKELEINVEG